MRTVRDRPRREESVILPNGAEFKQPSIETVMALRDAFDPMCRLFTEIVRGMEPSELAIPPERLSLLDARIYAHKPLPIGLTSGTILDLMPRVLKSYVRISVKVGEDVWGHISPIGAYGVPFAATLAYTNTLLCTIVKDTLEEHADQLKEERSALLKRTALHPLATFGIGIDSVSHSFALAMSTKIRGHRRYRSAIEALAEMNLPQRLSMKLPIGVLGPAASFGRYAPNLITEGGHGQLSLNPEFLKAVNAERLRFIQAHNKTTSSVGRGCPMGYHTEGESLTGVEAVTEVFMHVFRAVDDSGVARRMRIFKA
jgi:hypothetical protein